MAEAEAAPTPIALLKKRRDKATAIRSEFQPLLDDAYKYAIPYRKDSSEGRGAERVNEVFDHTAIVSAFRFAGKLQQDLAPPGETFFKLEPGPLVRDEKVKEQLGEELAGIRDVVAGTLLDGEWDNAFAEMALDLSAGTGAMLILEGEGDKLARFLCAPLSEILLESGGYGDVTGIFWKKKWSVRAIREAWPRAKFGIKLADYERNAPETEDGRELLEWIYDRSLRRAVTIVQRGMTSDQVGIIAAKRDGINELAFEIFRLVAEGRGEAVAPRT